jgi:hypothetical protein
LTWLVYYTIFKCNVVKHGSAPKKVALEIIWRHKEGKGEGREHGMICGSCWEVWMLCEGLNSSDIDCNIIVKEMSLRGISDADFANSIDDRRSIGGILVQLWNSSIAWTSNIQPTIALSTTEAEYMSLCTGVSTRLHCMRVEEVFMNNEAVDLMIYSLHNTCVVRGEKRSVLII